MILNVNTFLLFNVCYNKMYGAAKASIVHLKLEKRVRCHVYRHNSNNCKNFAQA